MKNENGFTLLEVLVSMTILAVVSLSMATSFTMHLRTNTRMEQKSGAIAAAQQALDAIRVQDIDTLPTSGSSPQTISIGGRDYQVTTTYCTIASYCAASSTRHITVGVNYRGHQIYSTETVYTKLS